MFVGRKKELAFLQDAYESGRSELIVLYGRRRVGKSALVHEFLSGKPSVLAFEGLEGERTPAQIRHFTSQLQRQIPDPLLSSVTFSGWESALSYVTDRVVKDAGRNGKLALFFDELPWMAAGQGKLLSLLKFFWDNDWKSREVALILCGSVASFMVRRVLRSQALYGRVTQEILLQGLPPSDARLLFAGKRSREEILKYLLVFGGIPTYLEEIRPSRSFSQNMNRLCFSPQGAMVNEVDRIFYGQFKEVQNYRRIVDFLAAGIHSASEISKRLNMASGGGLRQYLENLENAEIIRSYVPFDKGMRSNLRKYALGDEFLRFYWSYMFPHLRLIQEGSQENLFERVTQEGFESWLGNAFERFCQKNAIWLAGLMGFGDKVLLAGPHYGRGDSRFQVDLAYSRTDKTITVCEVKYQSHPIGTTVIPEMERKCALMPIPRGFSCEKALISLYGPDPSLANSQYFDHHVTLDDLIPSCAKT